MSDYSFAFNLNRRAVRLHVDPERLLIDVLRQDLGLTGTKLACDRCGECWACTVLVDGKASPSCLLPVKKIEGCSVTTIEGVGSPDDLHPLQSAFLECGAVQCGFCTPGLIMTGKALLDANPRPTRSEVINRFSRNLCRCTGYSRIVEAVLRTAQPIQRNPASRKDISPVVGESVLRQDTLEKVLGRTQYAADLRQPGMLFTGVLRSPHPHAEIQSLDIEQALRLPGVRAVLSARDVPGLNRFGSIREDQPLLAEDRVRFIGEPVVLVAAESEEVAQEAMGAVRVRYRPLPHVFGAGEALNEGAPTLHEGGNLCASRRIVKGDILRGFEESAVVVDEVYFAPFVDHASMEPEAGFAFVAADGTIEVHSCSQQPHLVHPQVAKILGVPPGRVRLVQTPMGGSFGGKSDMATEGFLALLTQRLNLPVQLVFSREDSLNASSKRHPFQIRCKMGADSEGRLTAIRIDLLGNTGAYTTVGPGVLDRAATHATGPYACPNVLVEGKMAFTNVCSCSAMRGFGAPQVHFALESTLDILAARLGVDPLEFRLRNAFRPGCTTATGQEIGSGVGMGHCLKALAKEYHLAREDQANMKSDGPIRRGIGLGCQWYGLGSAGRQNPTEVEVELQEDGTFLVRVGLVDQGQGSDTMFAQMAAETLGVPFECVNVLSGDTGLTLNPGAAHAGRTIQIVGRAIVRAAKELRERLRTVAAQTLEEKPENIRSGRYLESSIFPGHRISLRQVAELCMRCHIDVRCFAEDRSAVTSLDPETGQGVPFESYTWGAQMAEVDVNTETGEVKVVRVVAAHDVGKAINPNHVRAQIEGGVMMGLGYALKEEYRPGETRDLKGHGIPRIKDTPKLTTFIVEVPEPLAPFGAKAVAEPASVPTAPAILNAISDATCARITSLPATRRRVLECLKSKAQ